MSLSHFGRSEVRSVCPSQVAAIRDETGFALCSAIARMLCRTCFIRQTKRRGPMRLHRRLARIEGRLVPKRALRIVLRFRGGSGMLPHFNPEEHLDQDTTVIVVRFVAAVVHASRRYQVQSASPVTTIKLCSALQGSRSRRGSFRFKLGQNSFRTFEAASKASCSLYLPTLLPTVLPSG